MSPPDEAEASAFMRMREAEPQALLALALEWTVVAELSVPAVPDLPDWERLLAAERHLQHLLPVLATLEHASGWHTTRVQRPVVMLDQLDGVLTGVRQLRRTVPLETEESASNDLGA